MVMNLANNVRGDKNGRAAAVPDQTFRRAGMVGCALTLRVLSADTKYIGISGQPASAFTSGPKSALHLWGEDCRQLETRSPRGLDSHSRQGAGHIGIRTNLRAPIQQVKMLQR